eukprot:214598_1
MNIFIINTVLSAVLLTQVSISSQLTCKITETSLNRYWTHNNILKPEGCIDRSNISLRKIDHGAPGQSFFFLPRNGGQRGCDIFGDMKCDIAFPEQYDSIAQSRLIEDSIWIKDLYGLALTLVTMNFADAIEAVDNAGIQVFTYGNGITDFTNTPSQQHIGPDNLIAGYEACKRLMGYGATKILILNPNQFAGGLKTRQEGCESAIGVNNTKTIYVKALDLEYSAQLLAETMINDIELNAIMALGPVGETSAHYALLSAINEVNTSFGYYGLTADRITNDNFKGMGTFDYSQDVMKHILDYNFTKFGIDNQPYIQSVLSMAWLGIEAATSNSLKYQTKILSGPVFVETKETIELLGCIYQDVYYCDEDIHSDEYKSNHWGEIPNGCQCIDTKSKNIYLFHHGGDSNTHSGLSDYYNILSNAAQQAAKDINVTLHIITDQGSNNQLDLVSLAETIEKVLNNNKTNIDGIITTIPNEYIANIFSNIAQNIPIIGIADGYNIYLDKLYDSTLLPFIGQNDKMSGYNISDLLHNKYPSQINDNITREGLICLDATSGSLASHNERCLGAQQFAIDNDLEFEIVYTDNSNSEVSRAAIENA